jgi:hypothetical protein
MDFFLFIIGVISIILGRGNLYKRKRNSKPFGFFPFLLVVAGIAWVIAALY